MGIRNGEGQESFGVWLREAGRLQRRRGPDLSPEEFEGVGTE